MLPSKSFAQLQPLALSVGAVADQPQRSVGPPRMSACGRDALICAIRTRHPLFGARSGSVPGRLFHVTAVLMDVGPTRHERISHGDLAPPGKTPPAKAGQVMCG